MCACVRLRVLLFESYSQPHKLMGFRWRVNDSKSRLVSRTLLSILADLKTAVVWMIYTFPLISMSSSPFINTLVIVPSEQNTIAITDTLMFHSFFSSLTRSRLLLLLLLFSLRFFLHQRCWGLSGSRSFQSPELSTML